MSKKSNKKSVLLTSSCMAGAAMLFAVPVTPAQAATPTSYTPCATDLSPPQGNGNSLTVSIGGDGNHGPPASFDGPGHQGTPGKPSEDSNGGPSGASASYTVYLHGGEA